MKNLILMFVKKVVFVMLRLFKLSSLFIVQTASLQTGAWTYSLMHICFSFTKPVEVETSGRDDWMDEKRALSCLRLKWFTDGSKPGTSTNPGIHGKRKFE